MFDREITGLLQKSLSDLPLTVIGRTLRLDLDELVAGALPGMRFAVIDDRNTAEKLGDRLAHALKCSHITLPGIPIADDKTVNMIRAETTGCDALIAAGSGTINDLCKYAAFLDNKPYIIFPTAASMNGYLSANASITVDGYKKTMAARMPKAAFCDLSIIAAAPAILSVSGLGDSLARPTAQADWLLSHIILGTAYDELPFALLTSVETFLFASARGVATGDLPSIELLMRTLLLSGLGMTIAGGSMPASQGEHMIAHAMEMMKPSSTFHGQQIGVTTLFMAHLQERLLQTTPRFHQDRFDSDAIAKLFGDAVSNEAKKAFAQKEEKIRNSVIRNWPDIAHRIVAAYLPPAKILSVLKAAEAPDTPEALGWNSKDFGQAAQYARFLRDRFTFLDLEA